MKMLMHQPRASYSNAQQARYRIEKCTLNQPFLEKWSLSIDGSKLTSTTRSRLYTSLYGVRTLEYWAKKDNLPMEPTRILWEESRLARKSMSRAQRRIDTKLLCNQCGLAQTLFNRRHKDTHHCPVCDPLVRTEINFLLVQMKEQLMCLRRVLMSSNQGISLPRSTGWKW